MNLGVIVLTNSGVKWRISLPDPLEAVSLDDRQANSLARLDAFLHYTRSQRPAFSLAGTEAHWMSLRLAEKKRKGKGAPGRSGPHSTREAKESGDSHLTLGLVRGNNGGRFARSAARGRVLRLRVL